MISTSSEDQKLLFLRTNLDSSSPSTPALSLHIFIIVYSAVWFHSLRLLDLHQSWMEMRLARRRWGFADRMDGWMERWKDRASSGGLLSGSVARRPLRGDYIAPPVVVKRRPSWQTPNGTHRSPLKHHYC